MIVNQEHKFVFIHVPKTAGRSIGSAIEGYKVSPIHAYAIDNRTTFKDFFMFGFVRNPWDWLLSLYSYGFKTGKIKQNNFRDWLLKEHWWQKQEMQSGQYKNRTQWQTRNESDLLTDKNGKIIVDFVGKFEQLQQDVDILRNKYKIPIGTLPHKNITIHKKYQEVYDIEMKEFVEHHHQRDIQLFGYLF